MKAYLKDNGMPHSGLKAALIARIKASF